MRRRLPPVPMASGARQQAREQLPRRCAPRVLEELGAPGVLDNTTTIGAPLLASLFTC